MSNGDLKVFIQQPDRAAINMIAIAGGVIGLFFVVRGYSQLPMETDTFGAGVLIIIASLVLAFMGSFKTELILLEDSLKLVKTNILREVSVEIPYQGIQAVERTEYLGSLRITGHDGRKMEIAQYFQQVSGEPLKVGEVTAGTNATVLKVEGLIQEIKSRINLT